MPSLSEPDRHELARAWLDVDPDPETRMTLEAALDAGVDALDIYFGASLRFGTAGIRGPLGPGPTHLNRVLIRVLAAALGDRLLEDEDRPRVVIGYDARHNSDHFAMDTARVLAARGVATEIFPSMVPTPVLAFATARTGASAGVMVTASHNPRSDNGYKVYWRGGAQIVPPIDSEISHRMDELELLSDGDLALEDDALISVLDQTLFEEYLRGAVALIRPAGARAISVAYTALHGVGRDALVRAFELAGFAPPHVVASQSQPDGTFPTVAFPNPEEPGALDALMELGAAVGADVALAHDPDADRLAVAVPDGPSWRRLTGDELGCVIADRLLARSDDPSRLVVNTVVSSGLLAVLAAHHGAHHVSCLTGFKWVMQARRDNEDLTFVMGYEEALGYAIGDLVADKDGITAALVVAEIAAELAEADRTILDVLDELHLRHGVHLTGQRSVVFAAAAASPSVVLRSDPPKTLGGESVVSQVDYATGVDGLPPTDLLALHFDGARLMVRPSGTEPKVKLYGEVVADVDGDLTRTRGEARGRLAALLDALVEVCEP
jgi:phosphomannomutase